MWRDALLIASKDLRIELRSKVSMNQILPFAFVVLIIFAFALDTSPGTLRKVAPGLFWVAVLFSAIFAVERSSALESDDRAGDGLLVYGVDPAGIFLGKVAAIFVQLFALEIILFLGIIILYGINLASPPLLVASAIFATLGLCGSGVTYSQLSASSKAKHSLLPLLLVPIASPVLLAGTKAWQDGLAGNGSLGDPWLRLLIIFAVVYLALGAIFYGTILEE